MDYLSTLSANIREYRRKKNMTQEALAEILGVTPTAISEWERNKKIMSLNRLIDIAQALDVNLGDLLGISVPINDDAAQVMAAVVKYLHFDPITRTMKVESHLNDFLNKLANIEMTNVYQTMPEEAYNAWIKSEQDKYREIVQDFSSTNDKTIEYVYYNVIEAGTEAELEEIKAMGSIEF